jgi:hypothetical protein
MGQYVSALLVFAVTGVFMSALHEAAALLAPLQPAAGASLQRTHAAFTPQVQLPDEYAVADAASLVKTTAGEWHTAQLSVARGDLAATSLPSQGLALFAGGFTSALL